MKCNDLVAETEDWISDEANQLDNVKLVINAETVLVPMIDLVPLLQAGLGVCRHLAPFAAILLQQLINQGETPENYKIIYFRSNQFSLGPHAVVVLKVHVSDSDKTFIVDPALGKVVDMDHLGEEDVTLYGVDQINEIFALPDISETNDQCLNASQVCG